jgi:hypothetical protein
MGPLDNLWAIVSVPDNVPILFMLALVAIFTRLAFVQARRNDRLVREGRREVLRRAMEE